MTESQQRGRLAQMIATRGGLAPPEAPFVIEHREALIYMLCQAAELEHGIMCQYLYAAFSLKQSEDEGLTEEEAEAVNRWRKHISHIATQEMLHLSLVQNLLSAIGAAPHLSRPNFPQPARHYPAGVNLALLPFGEDALRHFMFLERPEGMDIEDVAGMAAFGRAAPAMQAGDIVPARPGLRHRRPPVPVHRAGLRAPGREVRRGAAVRRPAAGPGDRGRLRLARAGRGDRRGQRAARHRRDPGAGRGAARPLGETRTSASSSRSSTSTSTLREANPAFDPVRPVVPVNVRPAERDTDIPLVSDPVTSRVMDLFNVSYEILLLMLQRFFARTEETPAQLKALADGTVALMFGAIKPLGDLVTTLPAGPEYPGRTAGPSFELFYESDYVLPHREAAWLLLTERLRQAADFCDPGGPCDPAVTEGLGTIRAALPASPTPWPSTSPPVRARKPPPRPRTAPPCWPEPKLSTKRVSLRPRHHLRAPRASRPPGAPTGRASPPDAPRVAARLVASVLRPYAGQATQSQDPPPAESHSRPSGTSPSPPPPCAPASAPRPRPACSRPSPPSRTSPSRQAPPGDRAARRIAELGQLQRELPPAIVTAKNGPYLVTNVTTVRTPLGESQPVPPTLALCRCGASATKPFCDGAHATSGFTDGKDPDRVPDQRDTYPGTQVTIFDNRGICQHSGLCTDRAPTAFRTSAEPFVAPSGARLDELVRAVRDCPSGALSLAFDRPADARDRDLADWHGTRERAIEVTQDGPYRVTGGIPLADADGARRAPGRRARPASTTRSAAAATRRTSRSAAACTGTSTSATRPCPPTPPCSSGPAACPR